MITCCAISSNYKHSAVWSQNKC